MSLPPNTPDEIAWHEYRELMIRFVKSRLPNDHAAAQDIVHDALVKAHAGLDRLSDESKLQSWLYQITRNAITDHFRAQRPTEALPDDIAEVETTPPRDAERELAQCMKPLLARLPESYREAIQLVELDGQSQEQAAQALGLSLSGAKSRVQRGRRLLRGLLDQCCRIEVDTRGGIVDYEAQGGDACSC